MGKLLLIVEDERPLAHALELKLKSVGYETVVASNGQEALDALDKQKFDMMLLDLMLPVMDGFQVLEQMNKKQDKPVVVVLTNLGQLEDEKRARELGAKKYLVKSDTPLSALVRELESAF